MKREEYGCQVAVSLQLVDDRGVDLDAFLTHEFERICPDGSSHDPISWRRQLVTDMVPDFDGWDEPIPGTEHEVSWWVYFGMAMVTVDD